MEPSSPGRSPPTAWQPFTFGGVAAFATGSTIWLWVLLLGTGLLLGWGAVSYLRTGCYPAIEAAMQRLPAAGEIRDGLLRWPTNAVAELANTRLLALIVNPESAPVPGQGSADVVVELTARALTLQSLFGYWVLPYPVSARIPLSQGEVEPLWAAWQPHIRAVLPVGFALGLLLFWLVVAALVAPLVRLLAALLRREVTFVGCWRLAVVATVPAGCGTAFGLLLYASRGFHLVDTLITWLLVHLYTVSLWCGAPFRLPPRLPRSPFLGEPAATPDVQVESAEPPRVPDGSPFAESRGQPDPQNPFAVPPTESEPAVAETLSVSVLVRPRSEVSSPTPPPHQPAVLPAPTPRREPTPAAASADEDPMNPS